MEHIFGLSKPISSIYFLTGFPSKLSLKTNHLLENVAKNGTKLFDGPYVWCFLGDSVTLGRKEHHLFGTHSIF